MDANESLLSLVRERQSSQQKQTPFGHGILTADRYVQNMQDWVGLQQCYKLASTRQRSFGDALLKASKTLVYSNDEMDILETPRWKAADNQPPDGIEWPKNMLMSFTHVLTTPRKDRDGDILRTDGAAVDPKLPLLWQHVHTLPIGKMVYVVEHNAKRLILCSAIVDINELAHDAAVMVDNGMARFSHGFRALEFSQLKESDGETTGGGGFDVKRFEIMEESIVSVPSNVDAEVIDKMLGLVEGGQLKSPLMRSYGPKLREFVPVVVQSGLDLAKSAEAQGECEDESQCGVGSGVVEEGTREDCQGECSGQGDGGSDGDGCSPEETPDHGKSEQGSGETADAEVSGIVETADPADVAAIEEREAMTDTKAGRKLSKSTVTVLKTCLDDMDELIGDDTMKRSHKALCQKCHGSIKGLLDSMGCDDAEQEEDDEEYMKAVAPVAFEDVLLAAWVMKASERALLVKTIQAAERAAKLNQSYSHLGAMLGE